MQVTISPAEFGVLVDLALNSNAPVGRVLQFGDLFQRAAKLANSKGVIGEVPFIPTVTPTPPALGPSGKDDVVLSDF